MTLAPGTRIGPYEITGSLGAGGMGEVYRARDSRLERDVAIKILPERWLRDQERRARFDREARALASLNHPHIGAIYGIEEGDGVRALVLELIAGPTLADWLNGGPVAVRDALRIAVQIASALDAAHERGIIHRDLKPANVILRGARRSTAARPPSGPRKPDSGPGGELTVKVVDFGLAKEFETADAGADLADLPTRTQEATREGVLIGTVAYMSPEQARGERVDQRTDLWAFGCVLYEMLTGRAPFSGASLPDTLAAIVAKEPDWSALPSDTPAEVRRVLRRCLEKEWHQRLRDAGDVRIALEDAAERHDEGSPHPTPALAAPKRDRAPSSSRWRRSSSAWSWVGWSRAGSAQRDRPQSASPWRCGSRSRRRRPTIRCRSRCRRTASSSRSSPAPAGGRCCGCGRSTPPRRARFPGPRAPRTRSGRRTADRSRSSPIDTSGASTSSWARFKCSPPPTAGAAAPGGPTAPSSSNPRRATRPGPHLLVGGTAAALRVAPRAVPAVPARRPPLPLLRLRYRCQTPACSSPRLTVPARGIVVAADSAAVYSSGHLLFVRGSTLLAQRFDLALAGGERKRVSRRRRPPHGARARPLVRGRRGADSVSRRVRRRAAAVRVARPRRARDRQAGSTDGNVARTVARTG